MLAKLCEITGGKVEDGEMDAFTVICDERKISGGEFSASGQRVSR